ncbi:MAG: hypothetical protein K2K98_11565 [Muribaculaceae bacterium]|nr:hypothetical protein [Muribaculaceae bacterium]
MIQFLTTSFFRNRIDTLLKVKRGVYKNVHSEIVKEFSKKTIQEIRDNRDMILLTADNIIIKLRLPDKKQRLSKKDGYRLIYLVSKTKESVVFLDIYPKNGPSQQLDISDKELIRILDIFTEETFSKTLLEYKMP